jgi:manganese/iron transport system substrate-binding protein
MILDKVRSLAVAAAALSSAAALAGCGARQNPETAHPQIAPAPHLRVACTISTLCSLVAAVGGDRIDLHGLVPAGASPETFEPRPTDMVELSNAQVLFENGLGLEAWLQHLIESAGGPGLTIVTLSDSVPADEKSSGNPHLWMDPVYAADYVAMIAKVLEDADPPSADAYEKNASIETAKLVALDGFIRFRIDSIPKAHRAMICFHDAWFYFDRRYGIKDVGAIEPLPGQEPAPGSFARLIALAKANHVRAIFGEPQYSHKLADALASGAGISYVTDLYDDTLGTGGVAADYDSMMRHDVEVIVGALRR